MNEQVYEQGQICLRAHVGIIPIGADKRPAFDLLPRGNDGQPTWEPFQHELATESLLAQWCSSPSIRGLAVVGGAVSKNLVIIDFDDPAAWPLWLADPDVAPYAAYIPFQRTGGGGYQAAWRCPAPGHNQVLAMRPNKERKRGWSPRVETRAEGGYACIPPTLHPSGNRYQWGHGHFAEAPVFSMEITDRLLNAARRLNIEPDPEDMPAAVARQLTRKAHDDRDEREVNSRDDWLRTEFNNQYTTIEAALEKFGFFLHRGSNRYCQPYSENNTPSVLVLNKSISVHYSTSDKAWRSPFGVCDAFGIYCAYEHGDNYNKAMNQWASKLQVPRFYVDEDVIPQPVKRDKPLWHRSIPGAGAIVLTDHQWAAERLYDMGISVAYGGHGRWPDIWLRELADYKQKFVVFHPIDGVARNLARDAGAVLVQTLPDSLAGFLNSYDGSDEQMKRELAGYMARARVLGNDSTPNLLTRTV